MDPQKMKAAWDHLEHLDDRLTYKVRSKNCSSLRSPGMEQLDERLRELSEFTLELKEIVRELFLAMARNSKS
jgi:hypothetical protein